MISQNNKKSWRNPWFLGMIGVVLTAMLVNGVLIWYSLHNRSSLVDREYNTRNRKTDTETIKDIEAQNALAWKINISQPGAIVLATPVAYAINVVDRRGSPVSGEMEVLAYRAADATRDFATPFREASPGSYRGNISFPLKGYWELRIRIKRGKDVLEVDTDKFMVTDPRVSLSPALLR